MVQCSVLSLLSIFLSAKTSVANNSISIFLIVDSVSLNCSSGLKEFKILTLYELA